MKLRNRHGGLCFGHFAWKDGEGSRIVVSVDVRYLVSKRNLQLAKLLVWEYLSIQSWIQQGRLVLRQRLTKGDCSPARTGLVFFGYFV